MNNYCQRKHACHRECFLLTFISVLNFDEWAYSMWAPFCRKRNFFWRQRGSNLSPQCFFKNKIGSANTNKNKHPALTLTHKCSGNMVTGLTWENQIFGTFEGENDKKLFLIFYDSSYSGKLQMLRKERKLTTARASLIWVERRCR